MSFYIGIEDLAANALIELLTRKHERFVTYKELENYGTEIVDILTSRGEKAILILSRESTNIMFRNYSDIFEEAYMPSGVGIELKEGVTEDDLIERFRGYLSWNVLLAFVNKRSLAQLGV